MAGTLYVVATPIGNLEDITLRAVRILRGVELICAEDTRVTRKLLSHLDIHVPMSSAHQHSAGADLDRIVSRLVAGADVALVCDAGTPGISDPGVPLVRKALEAGVDVCPVPGASASLAALSVAGLPTGRFLFLGFPPRTKTDRVAFMAEIARATCTVVIYETSPRIAATLAELHTAAGNRDVCVGREITKKFETWLRCGAAEAAAHFAEAPQRGEFTVVVGPPAAVPIDRAAEQASAQDEVRRLVAEGVSVRDASRAVAQRRQLSRRALYESIVKEPGGLCKEDEA